MASLIDRFSSGEKIPASEWPLLAAEVRERIIATVAANGGHLASNLGVVELTIALLSIFNPASDRILWDVSHQCYTWKILTGRNPLFPTLRKRGGISGFLKRAESACDAFDAGHAGTAVSAALGMAAARDARGSDENIIAVVGDGAFANGLSLEALNNVAATTKKLIIILNDNEMSISRNVGALSRYFGRILVSRRYNRVKSGVESFAAKLRLSPFRNAYHWIESMIKSLFVKNGMVEALGIRYVGPIDGHNFNSLVSAITSAKEYDRPILLHVSTQKGRGYAPAEKEPWKWHGVSPFVIETGKPSKQSVRDYSAAFGDAIVRLARKDTRIAAITAGMRSGTGLDSFAAEFPGRFFDVGIAEEHAATFAAGLASSGMRPVVAVYSTFAHRSVDNIFHDICLQKLPVVFCLDRAGIVGADGPTHHGIFDIQLLRSMPGLTIIQPRDEKSLEKALAFAVGHDGPTVIRYPRGGIPASVSAAEENAGDTETISTSAEIIKVPSARNADNPGGNILWIWALGDMVTEAVKAAEILEKEGIAAGVVNPAFIVPFDKDLLLRQAASGALFATVENAILAGGFGSSVLEALSESGLSNRVFRFGWPEGTIPHGSVQELFAEYGMDAASIAKRISSELTARATAEKK